LTLGADQRTPQVFAATRGNQNADGSHETRISLK
jgi:hypothetical protein